jgi:hypothetical protein
MSAATAQIANYVLFPFCTVQEKDVINYFFKFTIESPTVPCAATLITPHFAHTVYLCVFLWFSQKEPTISAQSTNQFVFAVEMTVFSVRKELKHFIQFRCMSAFTV